MELTLDDMMQRGLGLLQRGMEGNDSYDPSRDDHEKDAYFSETSLLGQRLFDQRAYPAAESYFQVMLNAIIRHEQSSGKKFNRGMVYGNLGVAQIAGGKFDAGIAMLLAADWEDRALIVGDPHRVLNERLWGQFEKPKIFDYLIGFNNHAAAALDFQVDEPFLKSLVTELGVPDRVFFEGTIWAIRENLQLDNWLRQNGAAPNPYLCGRLYSGLKDLCLLTESLLRKRQIEDGEIQCGDRIMLGDNRGQPGLLSTAVGARGIGYPQASLSTQANSLPDCLRNLDDILAYSDPVIRRIYCLHLVRNFTGHHFDPSERVVSPSGESFFDMYETILVTVLSAILYFKHIGAI